MPRDSSTNNDIMFNHDLRYLLVEDVKEFNFKDKCSATRNLRGAATVPVAEIGRDCELALFSNAHIQQTLVPALNDLPSLYQSTFSNHEH